MHMYVQNNKKKFTRKKALDDMMTDMMMMMHLGIMHTFLFLVSKKVEKSKKQKQHWRKHNSEKYNSTPMHTWFWTFELFSSSPFLPLNVCLSAVFIIISIISHRISLFCLQRVPRNKKALARQNWQQKKEETFLLFYSDPHRAFTNNIVSRFFNVQNMKPNSFFSAFYAFSS